MIYPRIEESLGPEQERVCGALAAMLVLFGLTLIGTLTAAVALFKGLRKLKESK